MVSKIRFSMELDRILYEDLIAYCKSESRNRGILVNPDTLFSGFVLKILNKRKENYGMERDREIGGDIIYPKITSGVGVRASILYTEKERRELEAVGLNEF